MSPRRYAGWEPATVHEHDDQGRTVRTQPEPEWDDWDRELVDLLGIWNSGVHKCGHHITESADRSYALQAGFTVCRACQALQGAQEQQKRLDKTLIDQGHNPDYARSWFVKRLTEDEAIAAADVERKPAQQILDEAIATGD